MTLSRRADRRPSPPCLFDGPHWEIEPVRDVEVFFANLMRLLPDGETFCLAKSVWSEEGREFVRDHATPSEPPHPLPAEFDREPRFPIDARRMALLADMAERHAAPELAIHLAVYTEDLSLLEWFDFPDDPIYVSLSVPEERVADFAKRYGVRYQNRATEIGGQGS